MNENRKLIIFDGTLEKGGAERVISIISKRMITAGINVEIVLYYNRSIYYEIDPRINIVSVEKEIGSTNMMYCMHWLRSYFKKNAYCIISFLAPFNMVAIVSNLATGIPLIVADRNDPRRVPERFITRKIRDILYLFADGVVLQTTYNQKYFSKKIQTKSVVIFNPIELGDKTGYAKKVAKSKKIVTVGRLMEQKNQIMMIEAFASFHQQYPDYKLYIYGEGPMRTSLEYIIKKYNVVDSVFLEGQVDDVIGSISDAEVFLLTSNYEGMPNALIEAMCLGLPVISTSVSGATDLIIDGKNGFLVNCGDVVMLTKRMIQLVSSKQLRDQFSSNALLLSEKLRSDDIFLQWNSYINKIINK